MWWLALVGAAALFALAPEPGIGKQARPIFALIVGFMLYSIIFFRRKKGDKSDGDHFEGHAGLEHPRHRIGPLESRESCPDRLYGSDGDRSLVGEAPASP